MVNEGVAGPANQWLEDFARASDNDRNLDYLVSVVADRIVDALPQFLDPTLRPGLHASVRGNWKGFLAVVSREEIEVQSSPEVRDWARTLARRGFELPVLLSSYRIAQRATWDFINEVLDRQVSDPSLRSAVLVKFWSHAAQWMDTTVESLILLFTEEREHWQRSPAARRAAIVRSILTGDHGDIDAVSAELAYPLSGHHIAFTLTVDATVPDSETPRKIECAARALSSWLGGGEALIVPSGARSAWGWTAAPRNAEPPADGAPPGIPRFVRATVGNCHSGPRGFRISHSEAKAAFSVAGKDPATTRFEDVGIACLVSGTLDTEARSAFVGRELGSLADDDETALRLRQTLRAYLASGCDAVKTAQQLTLHPNGVRYRIRQAEKRMGHPIQQRRGHLEVALEIISVLGVAAAADGTNSFTGIPTYKGMHAP